jgi:hypothetical protein
MQSEAKEVMCVLQQWSKRKEKKALTLLCPEAGGLLPRIQQQMIAVDFPLCEGQQPHCSHRWLFEPKLTLLGS